MVITAITTLHVCVALFLIVIVLLQTGKGASIGAVFGGGSSQTLFGSSGAGNFLTKMTTAAAIIFMFTSLGISIFSSSEKTSTIDREKILERKEQSAVPSTTEESAVNSTAEEDADAKKIEGASEQSKNVTSEKAAEKQETSVEPSIPAQEPTSEPDH